MSERAIPRVGATGGGSSSSPTFIQPAPATTATRSSVANPGADTLVTIIAAAATPTNRRGVTVHNDQGAAGTAILYLALGAAATLTDFTLKMAPNSYYEVPFEYVGIITARWDVAGGSARVTEITP